MSLLPPLISFIHHFLKKKKYIFQRKTFQQYLKWHADSEPHCHCHDTPQYTFKQESTHGHHFAVESGCKEEKRNIILYANRCKREDQLWYSQHILQWHPHYQWPSYFEVNWKFSNFNVSYVKIYKQKQANIIYRTNLNGVCILMAELIADVLPLVVLFGSRWQSCWREFFYIATRGKRQHPDPFLSFPQVTLYQSASQASCLPPHHGIRWIRVAEPKVSIQSPDKGRQGYDSSAFFNSLPTSAFLLRLSVVEQNRPCWHYHDFLTHFWLFIVFHNCSGAIVISAANRKRARNYLQFEMTLRENTVHPLWVGDVHPERLSNHHSHPPGSAPPGGHGI